MRIVLAYLFRLKWAQFLSRPPFVLRRAATKTRTPISRLLLAMPLMLGYVTLTQAQIRFPISVSQDDHFPGSGGYMHTEVSISKSGDGSGYLSALTHTWEVTDFRGFRGSVAVAVLDGNKGLLWVSNTQNYGVDGRKVPFGGPSDREDDWTDTIPVQKMSQARYVAIKQRWNPRPVADDINTWLQGISDVVGELGSALQPLQQGLEVKDYYPLVALSENFIAAFVTELDKSVPIKNRNIYIIGGSTGGALALRMGHRSEPWIKKIVAWNPASVWTSYTANDVQKGVALNTGFGRSTAAEDPGKSRRDYFDQAFGMPTKETQPNPEEWYRGNRGDYAANRDTQKPFRNVWQCKWDYIAATRLELEEIYNDASRRWHWRLGTEVLVFSFFDDDWLGPANNATDAGGKPANYLGITKPTLLAASDDDDWNEGETLFFPRHWENRWTQTRDVATSMRNTPGYTLWLPNTGHSIHNERPNLFAKQIVTFLASNTPNKGPLEVRPLFEEPKSDEACQPQLPQFPAIRGELLDNPDSAKFLMEKANLHGNFSNGNSPGQYSLRLKPELRDAAQRKSPLFDLGQAAALYYNGDNLRGNAFADLAVTGHRVYEEFRKHQPTQDEVTAEARALLTQSPFASHLPLDELKLRDAAGAAQNRAYEVAWALRNPNAEERYQVRRLLGWIAVSGEDDAPDRPVNVPSGIPIFGPDGKTQVSSYPQYDMQVTMCPSKTPPYEPYACPAGTSNSVLFRIRYTIASPQSGPPALPSTGLGYQVGVLPPDSTPTIPVGDDIILYIHGGPGSRLEEASDLVKPLHDAGLARGNRYTVISFDQPSQGYSSMVNPTSIVPSVDQL